MRFRRMLLAPLIGLVALFAAQAEQLSEGSPFAGVGGAVLTSVEKEAIDGSLHVRGTQVNNRSRPVRHRYRSSNSRRPHCDVIAGNTARRIGRETSHRSRRVDYNRQTVSQIYRATGHGGRLRPPPGSSGYIYTFDRNGVGHMQVYSRSSRARTAYLRYSNRSYPGTSRRYAAGVNYRPDKVFKQVFVPLPRRAYHRSWHR